MHEMGIAQQLVTIALDAIPDDIENPRVEKMNLRIGKLAAVVAHSLSFCLEVIARETRCRCVCTVKVVTMNGRPIPRPLGVLHAKTGR